MTKYNLDKLIKIECKDFYSSNWYVYKKKKSFLGIQFQKEGVYKLLFNTRYLGLEIPEFHVLKYGIIYEKPEAILYFEDGYKTSFVFDTLEEVNIFIDKIVNRDKDKWL